LLKRSVRPCVPNFVVFYNLFSVSKKMANFQRERATGIDFHKSNGNITPAGIQSYIEETSITLHPAQRGLIEETIKHPRAEMMGDVGQLQFFECLMRNMNAKKVIDVGVFTGCSALAAALSIPDDGKVFALDVNEDFVNVGRPFFAAAGVEHKIEVRIGAAIEGLDKLLAEGHSNTIDFVFIDAIKLEYLEYFERAIKLLRKGGIIAFDNMLQGGRVLTPEGHQNAAFCTTITESLRDDPRVMASLLPIGDGVLFAFKV